jgi:lysosomal acid lipase/cholesteryl ester hydrolase
MAAGTLIPDYFNERLNLAILLAPPASMKNLDTKIIRFESQPPVVKLIVGLMETIHLYNILPKDFLTTGVPMVFCSYFDNKLCDLVLSIFVDADPSIDLTSPDRWSMALSNMPAGSGIFNYVHYAQLIVSPTEVFRRFDYGKTENVKKYGQETPPDYDLSLIKFPVAIMSGDTDKMADPKDVKWTASKLQHTLVFNKEYHLGHLSFAIAKDMSFFTQDAMDLINKYNN